MGLYCYRLLCGTGASTLLHTVPAVVILFVSKVLTKYSVRCRMISPSEAKWTLFRSLRSKECTYGSHCSLVDSVSIQTLGQTYLVKWKMKKKFFSLAVSQQISGKNTLEGIWNGPEKFLKNLSLQVNFNLGTKWM